MIGQAIRNDSYKSSKVIILSAFDAKKPSEVAQSGTGGSSVFSDINVSAVIGPWTSHVLNCHIVNGSIRSRVEISHVRSQCVFVTSVRKLAGEVHAA